MSIVEFKPAPGSVKKRIRRARGNASGHGGESGRGHKGQKSRTGYSRRAGFEGGQMPLYRRLPKKRGFTVASKVAFAPVNLQDVSKLATAKNLVELGILDFVQGGLCRPGVAVKILGDGDFNSNITLYANAFSKVAVQKIEAAGGKVVIL